VACKYKDARSPPREVIVRSLVACACKESSPKDVALAVLLGQVGPHAVSSKYVVDAAAPARSQDNQDSTFDFNALDPSAEGL